MEQRTTARRTSASGATDSAPRSDIRIIDATSRWGEMAGRTLAELGAEIIKIEPPQGCEPRRVRTERSYDVRQGNSLCENLHATA